MEKKSQNWVLVCVQREENKTGLFLFGKRAKLDKTLKLTGFPMLLPSSLAHISQHFHKKQHNTNVSSLTLYDCKVRRAKLVIQHNPWVHTPACNAILLNLQGKEVKFQQN